MMGTNANLFGLNGGPCLGDCWGGASVLGSPSNGTAALQRSAAYAQASRQPAMHNTEFSLRWSQEEQAILEESLAKYQYASETTLEQHLNIALQLNGKTARDVALRTRWMTRTKKIAHPSLTPSVHLKPQPNIPLSKSSMLPTDDDDISYKAIDGRTRQLLQNNADALMKITTNLDGLKLQENIRLFCDTRDNIFDVLKELNNQMPETMKEMPPLPVEINEELANCILPGPSMPRQP